jgi:hypothetical protein
MYRLSLSLLIPFSVILEFDAVIVLNEPSFLARTSS